MKINILKVNHKHISIISKDNEIGNEEKRVNLKSIKNLKIKESQFSFGKIEKNKSDNDFLSLFM